MTTEAARPFDVASALDNLRQVRSQAAAFAHAKVDLFDQVPPPRTVRPRRRRESLSHLIQVTAEAIDDALEAGAPIAAELASAAA